MDDLVDRERRGRPLGVVAVVLGQCFGDFVKPFVELRCRTRVERREAADDPGGALRDDEFWTGDDEQRGAHGRQAQP
jgi:hypothetical protein